MTGTDFPALQAAARDSVIGQAIASLAAISRQAASTAAAPRWIAVQAKAVRSLNTAAALATGAVALFTACVALWVLSWFVPVYVSTAIPRSAFLFMALVFAAAAAGARPLATHWSSSRMRRITAWLRAA